MHSLEFYSMPSIHTYKTQEIRSLWNLEWNPQTEFRVKPTDHRPLVTRRRKLLRACTCIILLRWISLQSRWLSHLGSSNTSKSDVTRLQYRVALNTSGYLLTINSTRARPYPTKCLYTVLLVKKIWCNRDFTTRWPSASCCSRSWSWVRHQRWGWFMY